MRMRRWQGFVVALLLVAPACADDADDVEPEDALPASEPVLYETDPLEEEE